MFRCRKRSSYVKIMQLEQYYLHTYRIDNLLRLKCQWFVGILWILFEPLKWTIYAELTKTTCRKSVCLLIRKTTWLNFCDFVCNHSTSAVLYVEAQLFALRFPLFPYPTVWFDNYPLFNYPSECDIANEAAKWPKCYSTAWNVRSIKAFDEIKRKT